MYVCMYVCMYVFMYACMFACLYICMHVYMYVCMYVWMYVCMYVSSRVNLLMCARYVASETVVAWYRFSQRLRPEDDPFGMCSKFFFTCSDVGDFCRNAHHVGPRRQQQQIPTGAYNSLRWRRSPGDRKFRLLSKAHHVGDAHQATESSDFLLMLNTLATPTQRSDFWA